MINFYYKKISSKSFDDTVEALSAEIENNKFKVLYTHDVQATFAGKGIESGPYKIIEFCRAPAAKKVLDADPMIGLFLPCRAVVFVENDKVVISAMRPSIMESFFPDTNIGELAKDVENDILKIVDNTVYVE